MLNNSFKLINNRINLRIENIYPITATPSTTTNKDQCQMHKIKLIIKSILKTQISVNRTNNRYNNKNNKNKMK